MYQSHFHLNDRPFASAPNPEHYFPASSIEQAREAIALNVERAAGVTLLMGPVGSGKTLLCQLIANHFTSDLPVCMLPGERVRDRTVLLQLTLHRLGLPFRGQDEGELRLTLTNHVAGAACPKGILMIVDEADRLPLELLEEIRVITNLVQDGQPRVRLVLAGAARLEERVGHPKLESLNQRVVGRLHLDHFSEEETIEYVKARITSCGGDAPSVFTDDALRTIYRATAGVPRLINQVCDHALLITSVADADQLDGRVIEEAWADLQQLPIPGSFQEKSPTSIEPDIVVEYGSLDDDDDTMITACAQLDELQQVVATINEETEGATIDIAGDVQLEDTIEISGDFEVETELVIGGNFEIEGESEPNSVQINVLDPQEVEVSSAADAVAAADAAGEDEAVGEAEEVGEAEATVGDDDVAVERQLEYALTPHDSTTLSAFVEDQEPSDTSPPFLSAFVENEESSDTGTSTVSAFVEDEESSDTGPPTLSAFVEDEESSDTGPPTLSAFAEDERSGIELFNENTDDAVEEERLNPEVIDETENQPTEVEVVHDETMEMTIEQAPNPFDEEFAEEEIVIQAFGSPSSLARQGQEYVTSGYSRHLAKQLSAAHPGLRMHSGDEVPEVEVESEEQQHEFRPLSAYIDDESDYEDESEVTIQLEPDHFDPSSDPVLPESVLTGSSAESSIAIGGEVLVEEVVSEAVQQPMAAPEVEIAVETPAEVASSPSTEATVVMDAEIEPRPSRAKKKRVFRRLFSSMRRS